MKEYVKSFIRGNSIFTLLKSYKDAKSLRRFDKKDIDKLNFYSRFIYPGDIVFDVGANMGNRTKIFLKIDANVVAFEPQKPCADFLEKNLSGITNFRLVRSALGGHDGEANMLISSVHTISSLSEEWINATKKSGRFSHYEWKERQSVKITTLDASIKKYGVPSFIKIDVEGYEFEVLSGLSMPIKNISIEFTPEYIENTNKCIDYMNEISSDAKFQLSIDESMKFELNDWVSAKEVKNALSRINPHVFGDVYIRCS